MWEFLGNHVPFLRSPIYKCSPLHFTPSLSFPYSYLPIRLCCTDALGSHLVFTSGFTSIPWNCRDCLALRVTPPPLSNPWACFWLSDNIWAKKILQRCAEGVKNEQPTADRGIGEAPLPAQEQARLLPRDLCQRLRARCSAEPSPCSDQPLSTSSPFLRGLCSPKKCNTHALCCWMGSTSSIRLISPPLLSRVGNETASLLAPVPVV